MSGWIPTTDPEAQGLELLIGRVFPLFDLSVLYETVNFTTYFDGSINFRHIANPILDFLVIDNPGGVAGVFANQTPSAQECVLSWCVKRMESQVYGGNLTHKITSESMQPVGEAPFPWWMSDDGLNIEYTANFSYSPPDANDTFTVSNTTTYEVISLLGLYFPMTITGTTHNDIISYRFPWLLAAGPWVRKIELDSWSAGIVERVNGTARLMTSVLMTSFDGARNVYGTAWASEVFVSVSWKWFSLPFALLLLSLIFLLTTIFKSAEEEQDIGIWKTSALPVLMNGLRGDVRRKMGNSTKMGDIRSQARTVDMKLQFGKKGYRLSGMPGSVWTSSPEQNSRTWI